MAISWVVLGILFVLVLVLAKFKHIKHKTFLIIGLLLITFFYISISNIIGEQNLDLSTASGVAKAAKVYFSWLVHAGGNAKQLAGNAIKMDWVGNITSSAG